MNRFFALLLAASCLTAVGQTEYPYPYNPDGNNDGYISLNDLLDLLSVYGAEFNAGVLATDSISAVYYTGELDYYDCASSCVALRGNWKMLDKDLVGSYKQLLSNQSESAWLDVRNAPLRYSGSSAYSSYVSTSSWQTTGTQTQYLNGCFCQTRTRADIEDINVCEGLEDECGVCNGEGAIYECGCSDIPEGDCDCEGNKLDAIGVCGGDCLEDVDGDGVCDPVLGPCEGQDYVTYHGYDYEIVETADGRCWFAEDLKTSQFNDDTTIPNATEVNEWPAIQFQTASFEGFLCCVGQYPSRATPSSYVGFCYDCPYPYDGSIYESDTYNAEGNANDGILYNWGAVNSEKLCPVGFHIPSSSEWNNLLLAQGQNEQLRTLALLPSDYVENNGCSVGGSPIPTLNYGESQMSLGSRSYIGAYGYYYNTTEAQFWSSTPNSMNVTEREAYILTVTHCGESFNVGLTRKNFNEGHNVRCIKD